MTFEIFDWKRFLDKNGIEWQQGSGENIEIKCVFCGIADQGKHLSISTNKSAYRCWRKPDEHYGKSPIRLLMHLLNISAEEAKNIAGYDNSYTMSDDGDTSLVGFVSSALNSNNNISRAGNISPIKTLLFPDGFRPIKNSGGTRSVYSYIRYRGYSDAEVEGLIELYDLKTTLDSTFRYRVIIPIRMPNIGLVNWTARSITASSSLRYQTLTTDPIRSRQWGMPLAVLQINQTLWNYNRIYESKARNLVVCEGPFDAIRVDYFGAPANTRATCVFGKSISSYQITLLERVRNQYDNLYLVLDEDAEMESLKKLGALSHLEPRFLRLPSGVNDPAELPQMEIKKWLMHS